MWRGGGQLAFLFFRLGWDLALWYSICFACRQLQVQSSASPEGGKVLSETLESHNQSMLVMLSYNGQMI